MIKTLFLSLALTLALAPFSQADIKSISPKKLLKERTPSSLKDSNKKRPLIEKNEDNIKVQGFGEEEPPEKEEKPL